MLDIQIVHPTLPVIMLGDFNIVLEERDSIIRHSGFYPLYPCQAEATNESGHAIESEIEMDIKNCLSVFVTSLHSEQIEVWNTGKQFNATSQFL